MSTLFISGQLTRPTGLTKPTEMGFCPLQYGDLFGTDWTERFDELYDNIRTKRLTRHHCTEKHAPTRKCYEIGHMAFCTVKVRGKDGLVRCGQRFGIQTRGCGKHPRVDGWNKAVLAAFDTGVQQPIEDFDVFDPKYVEEDDGDEEMGLGESLPTNEQINFQTENDVEAAIASGHYDPRMSVQGFQEREKKSQWASKASKASKAQHSALTETDPNESKHPAKKNGKKKR